MESWSSRATLRKCLDRGSGMTVIAWDGKTLAADKMAVVGTHKGGTTTKIFRWEGGLCGLAGGMAQGLAVIDWLQNGADKDSFPKDPEHESSILVITNCRKVLYYEDSPIALPFENTFHAIGSGRDYALAALYLGKSAKEAVEIACQLDAYCGNGVDTLEL